MSVGFMTVDGTNINVIVLPRVCRLQTIFSYYITNVCALNQDSNIRDCILHCKKKKRQVHFNHVSVVCIS